MIKYLNNRKFARHEQMESNVKIGHEGVFFPGMRDERASLRAWQLLGIGMLFGKWICEGLDMHDVCSMVDYYFFILSLLTSFFLKAPRKNFPLGDIFLVIFLFWNHETVLHTNPRIRDGR